MNHAAHELFVGPKDPGAIYYGPEQQVTSENQVNFLQAHNDGKAGFEIILETSRDPGSSR